jgi:lipopolysaccharide transport system permease protein
LASTIIRPTHEHALVDARELWRYRQLFLVLVWRILKVRYRQTVVGLGWAILQPLMFITVFSIIFGLLARIPTEGQPYPIFVASGLLVWQFVAQGFQQTTGSIIGNAELVSRIYFPRILLLLATLTAALVDFLAGVLVMGAFMIWYGFAPTIGVVAFIPALLLAIVTVLGVSLWLGTLYVPYRDVGHLLPFMTQIWMFLSPVIYPLSLLPQKYELLYALNPIVVVVQTSRWAFANGNPPALHMVAISTLVAFCVLASGLWFFRRHEGNFADIV